METPEITTTQTLLRELDQANFSYEAARSDYNNLQRYASIAVMSVLFRILASMGDLHFDPDEKVYHINIQRGMVIYGIRASGYTQIKGE